MAFKIRPNYERIFSSSTQSTSQQQIKENTELVEDTVFVVDEETGEIKEEKQYVERQSSSSQVQSAPELPRKESARILSLSMKKRTKVSFM